MVKIFIKYLQMRCFQQNLNLQPSWKICMFLVTGVNVIISHNYMLIFFSYKAWIRRNFEDFIKFLHLVSFSCFFIFICNIQIFFIFIFVFVFLGVGDKNSIFFIILILYNEEMRMSYFCVFETEIEKIRQKFWPNILTPYFLQQSLPTLPKSIL